MASAGSAPRKFKIGDILEVTVDKPDEFDSVKKGSRGIVYDVTTDEEGVQYHANWVWIGKEDFDSNDGYILEKNLKLWAPPIKTDFKPTLQDLLEAVQARLLEVYDYRRPSSPPEKVEEHAKLLIGSTRGIEEFAAWLEMDPNLQEAFKYMGLAPGNRKVPTKTE